jgi:hypothetical protein
MTNLQTDFRGARSVEGGPSLWLPESVLVVFPAELQQALRDLQVELAGGLEGLGLLQPDPTVSARLATAALIEDLERLATFADRSQKGRPGEPLADVIALGHAAEGLETLIRQLRGWLRGAP